MKKFLALAFAAVALTAGAMSFYSGGGGGDASTDAGQTWAGAQIFTNAANSFIGTNVQAAAISWGNLTDEIFDDSSGQLLVGNADLSADGALHTPWLNIQNDGSGSFNSHAMWDPAGNFDLNQIIAENGFRASEGGLQIFDYGENSGDWFFFSKTNGLFTMSRENDNFNPTDTNTVFTLTPSGTLSVSNFIGKFTGDGSTLTGIPASAIVGLTNSGSGINGTNGATGLQGPQGIQGIQGVAGANGTNGVNGINGTNGVNGVNVTNNNAANINVGTLPFSVLPNAAALGIGTPPQVIFDDDFNSDVGDCRLA